MTHSMPTPFYKYINKYCIYCEGRLKTIDEGDYHGRTCPLSEILSDTSEEFTDVKITLKESIVVQKAIRRCQKVREYLEKIR